MKHWHNITDPVDHPDRDVVSEFVLPIVIAKDPFWWVNSMCKAPYNVQWGSGGGRSCPRLLNFSTGDPLPVRLSLEQQDHEPILHPTIKEHYPSLPDLWAIWYREYYESDRPRLIIRYEDWLFRPAQVFRSVQACIGQEGPIESHLRQHTKSSSQSRNLLRSMIRYGSTTCNEDRVKWWSDEEIEFADRIWAKEAMVRDLRYPLPSQFF